MAFAAPMLTMEEWIGGRLLQRGDITVECLRCDGEGVISDVSRGLHHILCPCCKGNIRVTDQHVVECDYCGIDAYAPCALGTELLREYKEYTERVAERKKPVQSEKAAAPPKMAFRLGRE